MGNTAPDGTPSLLSPDDYSYIRSTEFKERFGDWEKAWRLEKAKRADYIISSKNKNSPEAAEWERLRREKRYTELRRLVSSSPELKEMRQRRYLNQDTGIFVEVFGNTFSEILRHNTDENHIISIYNIPEIIKNSIYIDQAPDEKRGTPNKYLYFLSGLKEGDRLLTVKSVIKEDLRTGIRYYDHHIHDNPKELYLDTKKAEADFQTGYRITEPVRPENQTSAFYYDKRLYEICQCPQAKFLDKNFEPKNEIIDAVRIGKTLDDLLHTSQRREPSRSVLDQFLKDKGLDTPSRCVSPPQKEITNPKNNGFEL